MDTDLQFIITYRNETKEQDTKRFIDSVLNDIYNL